MDFVRGISVAAVAAALAACQSVNTPAPVVAGAPKAVPLAYGRSVEVQVDAAAGWRSAGIILSPSDTYRLTAPGTWSMAAAICGYSDADAKGIAPFCSGDPEGIGAPTGALIGRIGASGRPFKIGSALVLKAETSGELFLRSYDWLPEDNTGALTVRIAHDDAAVGGEAPPAHRDPL